MKILLFKISIFLILLTGLLTAEAQTSDTIPKTGSFSGAITLTSKGLSTFPNLTLGKPAAVFDFSVGGEKLRFEPTFRFALDGKPWTFIFWGRYELLKTNKFQFKLGAHPAYAFKTITVNESGSVSEIHRMHMYLAGEVAPLFFINKNIGIGPYYIYANGVSKGTVQNSNFISFRAIFSKISLSDKSYLKLYAQVYNLKLDDTDGFYINSTLSLNHRNFPFSISSTVNQKIKSTIAGDDFLWNINLIYSFNTLYKKL